MLFSYKAKLSSGEIFTGEMEATDRYALARDLRAKGNVPISIKKKKKFSFDVSSIESFISTVKTADLMLITKNLSGMLKAGLSLSRAISVLEKQTKNPKLKKIFDSLKTDINSGSALSSALEKFPHTFSKLFISMTRAGEESGDLSGALAQIGSNLEKSNSLRKRVKGALIYPGVIVSAMVIIGILMFAFVVPTLSQTFEDLGVELPATTQFVISLGNFFSNNLILSFVILIAIALCFIYLFKAKFMAKYVDYVVIRFPLIGPLAKKINTARTARTLSSLLLSGVSIVRALEITEDVVQNVYYRKILVSAREGIQKGQPLSDAFEASDDLYPVMMSEMIQVGEETGNLSKMLEDIAIFFEADVEERTKNLSTIIEPILMIIVGAGVGFFAVSMISPLYSVLDNIQ